MSKKSEEKKDSTGLILSVPTILSMCLFLPIFINMLLKGNSEDYILPFKNVTLWGNGYLFFVSLIVIAVAAVLMRMLSNFDLKGTGFGHLLTFISFLLVFATPVLLYFHNTSKEYGLAPDETSCALVSLSVLFSSLTAYVITKKNHAMLLTLILSTLTLGLTPWSLVSDINVMAVIFPILTLFFYALYNRTENALRFLFLTVSILSSFLGGMFKPAVYIVLAAIVLIELLRFIADFRGRLTHFFFVIIIMLAAVIVSGSYKEKILNAFGYEEETSYKSDWCYYLYTGLYDADIDITSEYDFITEQSELAPVERRELELTLYFDRLKEMGFKDSLNFYLSKGIVIFNDGTFGWTSENEDVPYALQKLEHIDFGTASEFLWILMLTSTVLFFVSTILRAIMGKDTMNALAFRSCFFLSFLGMTLYLMLFTHGASEIFSFLPAIMTGAILGINDLSLIFKEE